VYPLHPWIELRHYGRTGADGGVDIYAREAQEDGAQREWLIQCKRYKRASKADLRKIVTDALDRETKPPDVLLVILACDVSRASHEEYVEFAARRGIGTPLLWSSSIIEARLHCERRDLLFSFFGISNMAEARLRESTVTRGLGMMRRLHSELLKRPSEVDWPEAMKRPSIKFSIPSLIIHSVDDTSYPNSNPNETGISGWFRLQIWDFYHNGLELLADSRRAVINNEGNWALLEDSQEFDSSAFQEIRVYHLLRIPYRNIVDVDALGDEFYQEPHLYCRFCEGGEPYEGSKYVLAESDHPYTLEEDMRFELKPVEAVYQQDPTGGSHGYLTHAQCSFPRLILSVRHT
jgi:hypothetical protein